MESKTNNNYNGWSNYDTWLVIVWLQNDETNYRKTVHILEINQVQELTILDLQFQFYYGDDINWDNVNLEEIKSMIAEE